MYKISSFFFIIFLLPLHAYGTNCETTTSGCASYEGCYSTVAMGRPVCNECDLGTYNTATLGITDTCTSCENVDFGISGKLLNPNAYDYGQSECPWICDTNHYKLGSSCELCPNYSTTIAAGATSIDDCKCNSGYYMGGQYEDTCIQCSATQYLSCTDSGLKYNTTNGFSCSNGQLHRDHTNHTVSCQTCTDANATLSGGICYCNTGYYGTPDGMNTTCTKCPSGTTTTGNNNTNINSCKMTAATKFCDGNGNNCMNLLDFGTSVASGNNNIVNR